MGGIQAQVDLQPFGESLDGEFRTAVGSMGDLRTGAGSESIDTAEIEYMAFMAGHQQRHKSPGAVIDTEPVNIKNPLPSKKESTRIKKEFETAAKNTLKKTAGTNIRISEADLEGLKLIAAQKGIGYQTLISGILHQVASGQLKV